jgi:uncharacterized protein YycO
MNSSMAERRLVKPLVESSPESIRDSSAMFDNKYNSVMNKVKSTSICRKQKGALAEWIYALE